MDFELCIESLAEAKAANMYKFKRIELCSGLGVGGLTPSYGLITSCVEAGNSEIHVMIRPRPGDFNYSEEEFFVMQKDILAAAAAKAEGVVFGIMNLNRRVDIRANSMLYELAASNGLETTFHRAIDTSDIWQRDLDSIINIGFTRVLSSGGAPLAIDGATRLKQMVEQAAGRIQIMAGAGVNSENALTLASSKVQALHFSARQEIKADEPLEFGQNAQVDHEKIEGILKAFN